MGREIKRVPVGWDYPIGKAWLGYVNPYDLSTECPECFGNGFSNTARQLEQEWYGRVPFNPAQTGSTPWTPEHTAIQTRARNNTQYAWERFGPVTEDKIQGEAVRLCAIYNRSWAHHLSQADVDALVAEGRLQDFTRHGTPHPTAAQVNEWSLFGFGHDSLNMWICVNARCERMGASSQCEVCGGDGYVWDSQAEKAIQESWQRFEPPQGDGWQLWETVTEGSPISPVFATGDELVEWMVADGYSREGAEGMIESGWAPSLVMSPETGVMDGVDALGILNNSTNTPT